jgi:ribosome-associated protein
LGGRPGRASTILSGVTDDLEVTPSLVIPAGELRERFSRSSGPGGQGVNTADSRVELSLDVARSPSVPAQLRERLLARLAGRLVDGVLTVVASEHRSQLANRRAARLRMAALLRAAAAPPPPARRPTRPGPAAIERRLAAKRRRSQRKLNRRTDYR